MTSHVKNNKLHPVLPRFFAFLIDVIILGISCYFLAKLIISHTQFHPLVVHLIGTVYCLIYFAMLNSHVSLGKTIGKMICKIRVTDLSTQSISIPHSFVRSGLFILPLCFIGYLNSYAQSSVIWTIIQSSLICFAFACTYLVVFNTHSQQGLHDILTHTQVLRNSQSYIERQPIWKVHFYLIGFISFAIILYTVWNMPEVEKQDFSSLDPHITNITLNTHHSYIGEAQSISNSLIFDLKTVDTQQRLKKAEILISKFNTQNPNFLAQQQVDQVQINQSVQFGLFKFDQKYIYDIVENSAVISLIYSGEGQSINFIR